MAGDREIDSKRGFEAMMQSMQPAGRYVTAGVVLGIWLCLLPGTAAAHIIQGSQGGFGSGFARTAAAPSRCTRLLHRAGLGPRAGAGGRHGAAAGRTKSCMRRPGSARRRIRAGRAARVSVGRKRFTPISVSVIPYGQVA
jgi:hypothetical protein